MEKFIQHTELTSGKKGSAASHSDYIAGNGRHQAKKGVIYVEDANLPPWSMDDATKFFSAADKHERNSYSAERMNRNGESFKKMYSGRAYTEIVWSIPRRIRNPTSWARRATKLLMSDTHPYRLAVHCTPAADGGLNPHFHLMFSERRVNDGIHRDAQHFFKRPTTGTYIDRKGVIWQHDPSKGGAAKDRTWNSSDRPAILREQYRKLIQEEIPEYEFIPSPVPEIKVGPKLQGAETYNRRRAQREMLVQQQRDAKQQHIAYSGTETTLEWMLAEAELHRHFLSKGLDLCDFMSHLEAIREASLSHVRLHEVIVDPNQSPPEAPTPLVGTGDDADKTAPHSAADEAEPPSSEYPDEEDDDYDCSL